MSHTSVSDPSLYAFASQSLLARSMDLIANNLANANTPAYKHEQLLFADYLAKIGSTEAATSRDVSRDFSEGAFTHTGNTLDVAIKGEGFFMVETPEGNRFTRNGRFAIDEEGNLVTSQGHKVLDSSGGRITFSPSDTDIIIDPAGTVMAGSSEIGVIGVVTFDDLTKLDRAGASLYLPGGQLPKPATEATVIQGTIEESNIVPVREITKMISVMRGFQAMQKIADDDHERLRRAIQVLTQS